MIFHYNCNFAENKKTAQMHIMLFIALSVFLQNVFVVHPISQSASIDGWVEYILEVERNVAKYSCFSEKEK